MVTLTEFGERIKEKYPEYDEVETLKLATRVLEKYPEYKTNVKGTTEEIMAIAAGEALATGKDIAYSLSEGSGLSKMASKTARFLGVESAERERERYEPKTDAGKVGYYVGEYGAPLLPGLGAFKAVRPIYRGYKASKEGLSRLAKIVDKYAPKTPKTPKTPKGVYDWEAPPDLSGAKKLLRKSKKEIATDKIATDKKIAKEILEDQQLGDEVANAAFKTVKEQMFENASTLGNKTLTIKKLNDPEYIKKVGDDFRDSMNDVYKNEAKKMKKAIEKIPEDVTFDTRELLDEILPQLDDLALLDKTGKVTEFTSKPLLGKIIKELKKRPPRGVLDEMVTEKGLPLFPPEPIKMIPLELYNYIKALDGAIDYAAIKRGSVRDRGMQVVRRLFRKKLGAVSKEYDEAAKGLHNKLKAFGKKTTELEKLGGGERFALKNLADQEVTEIVRVLKEYPNKFTRRALKEFDTISGWTSWNKHFGTNPGILETLPYGGRKIEIVKSTVDAFLRPIRKKVVKGSLERERKKGIKKYIKKARQEASGIKPKPKRKPLLKKAASEIENILEREYIMEDLEEE
tara:strand:+ start:1221 stop:2933 length:1713 start_codon:yes stop_codon:yes gene_type:complete